MTSFKSLGRLSAAIALAIACAGCQDRAVRVSRADFGEQWPLTIDGGVLDCQWSGTRQLVTIERDGIMYAVNGSAKGFGFPDITGIRRTKDFEGVAVVVPLEPLIERGLKICAEQKR